MYMTKFFIGLMSGTSLDAVDAALVDFSSHPPKLIATHSQALPHDLKQELLALCIPGDNEINRMGELDVKVGKLFATVANSLLSSAKIFPKEITAIGSHGQTIRHHPNNKYPFTLQIGDPNVIANETGITTVADFRRRDIATGGQGAPLAPGFHNAIFRSEKYDRIILNLGGIANITFLAKDLAAPVLGFDTGPANTLLDAWANLHLNKPYDENGNWAASGKVSADLLKTLLADPYFSLPAPKSTGREYFNLTWLEKHIAAFKLPPEDIQATLCELTARSIMNAINKTTQTNTQILICGGGIKNLFLVERLKTNNNQHSIHSTTEFGVPPEWIEAMAFAWLAKQTMENNPSNLPSVTGAKKTVVLGGIYL